jgi:hypothetical protein
VYVLTYIPSLSARFRPCLWADARTTGLLKGLFGSASGTPASSTRRWLSLYSVLE